MTLKLQGQKFSMLTAIEPVGSRNKKVVWRFKCDCGKLVDVLGRDVKSGHTKSCGCLKEKHGKTSSGAHNSWISMKKRVRYEKTNCHEIYKNVEIHPEWEHDFNAFYAYMGDRPEGFSLDRIDNEKGYVPENVRWASAKTQANNKTNSKRVMFNGEPITYAQAAAILGCDQSAVAWRRKNGWSDEKIMSTPRRNYR